MKYLFIALLLFVCGCTSWHNPGLDPAADEAAVFRKDRDECRERAKKQAHSEPLNDLRSLKSYDTLQDEYAREVRAYKRCMRNKGWIRK